MVAHQRIEHNTFPQKDKLLVEGTMLSYNTDKLLVAGTMLSYNTDKQAAPVPVASRRNGSRSPLDDRLGG
jgi:hypothetical protein